MHKYFFVNPQFSHVVTDKRKHSDMHYHNDYELYYLVKGTTTYFIDDKTFFVDEGNFIIIPPNTYHMTDNEACLHNERVLISFSDSLITTELDNIVKELCNKNIIFLPRNKLGNAINIIEKMESEDKERNENENSTFLINLYIQELLIYLHRSQITDYPQLTETEKIIVNISKYISENYSSELTLKSLAKDFGLSESHLSRCFKEFAGIGLKEYINHIRLLNAEKLLKNTTMSITQVAHHCGFCDSNYFSTVFKRLKGVSPQKFSKEFH